MNKIKASLCAAATGLATLASPSLAATTVDLSATNVAQSSVTLNLAAGDYVVSFATNGTYKAWAPATPATSADGLTGNWWDQYSTTINGVTTRLYPFSGARFATADAAYDAFKSLTTTFSLATATAVTFSIPDTTFGDNSGGVSLVISAVPEPATWGMMLVGIGMIGGSMRYRRRATTVRYA